VSHFDKLAALLETALDLELELSPDHRFKDLPGWDSVQAMRLISHIEKAFGIKLPIKDYLSAETVGQVEALIERLAAK
jgi:acyl carrier protein